MGEEKNKTKLSSLLPVFAAGGLIAAKKKDGMSNKDRVFIAIKI